MQASLSQQQRSYWSEWWVLVVSRSRPAYLIQVSYDAAMVLVDQSHAVRWMGGCALWKGARSGAESSPLEELALASLV